MGRLPTDRGCGVRRYNPEMRVWTIQSVPAFRRLKKSGILFADGRRCWRCFRPAYRWMMAEMSERLPRYNGRHPLWLWVRWLPESPKPDLRSTGHAWPGTRCVRLELEISAESIVQFDHDLWHIPLNCGPEKSRRGWRNIFSLADEDCSIAAVTDRITIDQLRIADYFVAR